LTFKGSSTSTLILVPPDTPRRIPEGTTTMKARVFGLAAVLLGAFASTAAAVTNAAASGCCPCPFCK
jgi:hypothetical protein